MEGQKALRIHQKYLNLCSEDERRSFWVNYPVNICFLFRDDLFVAECDDSGSVVR